MSDADSVAGKISVLVDNEQSVPVRGALPLGGMLNQVMSTVTEIDRELLRRNFSKALKDVQHVLADVTLETGNFQVEDVTLSLTIGKSGEVSLVSITKGSVSAGTCIAVRLRRKA